MKLRYYLLPFSFLLIILSACQEESLSDLRSKSSPTNPLSPNKGSFEGYSGYNQANEHVSYFFPRFPRPLPCPVGAGCQLPQPLLHVSVPEGIIHRMNVKLYTDNKKLYACSGKECEGEVRYQKGEAEATLSVIDDQVKSEKLLMTLQLIYEVGGKIYQEEFTDTNVPLSLDMYKQVDNVLYRLPRPPRPLPCPVAAGCTDPKPELHAIVPKGKILKIEGELYTQDGQLYACSSEICEGEFKLGGQEALATFNVVNSKIEAESFILVFQITYEANGKRFSKEIYDKDIPADMD